MKVSETLRLARQKFKVEADWIGGDPAWAPKATSAAGGGCYPHDSIACRWSLDGALESTSTSGRVLTDAWIYLKQAKDILEPNRPWSELGFTKTMLCLEQAYHFAKSSEQPEQVLMNAIATHEVDTAKKEEAVKPQNQFQLDSFSAKDVMTALFPGGVPVGLLQRIPEVIKSVNELVDMVWNMYGEEEEGGDDE